MWVQSLGREDPLEEDMAAHSSILVWRIPGTEKPGGLQSLGSQRVTTEPAFTCFNIWKYDLPLTIITIILSPHTILTLPVYSLISQVSTNF